MKSGSCRKIKKERCRREYRDRSRTAIYDKNVGEEARPDINSGENWTLQVSQRSGPSTGQKLGEYVLRSVRGPGPNKNLPYRGKEHEARSLISGD